VRHPSTTPIQSLLLLNSKITLDAAQRLANKVADSHCDLGSQCIAVYRRVLSRAPDTDEQNECIEFNSR
jgi:hypothetical protein